MNIDSLTVDSARTAVLEKQATATELVDAFYQKIDAEDAAIGALSHLVQGAGLPAGGARLTRWPTKAMRCRRWPASRSR